MKLGGSFPAENCSTSTVAGASNASLAPTPNRDTGKLGREGVIVSAPQARKEFLSLAYISVLARAKPHEPVGYNQSYRKSGG